MGTLEGAVTIDGIYLTVLQYIFKYVPEVSLLNLRQTHRNFSQLAIRELFLRSTYISYLLQSRLVQVWGSNLHSPNKELIATWIQRPSLTPEDRVNGLILLSEEFRQKFELEYTESETCFYPQLAKVYSSSLINRYYDQLILQLRIILGIRDLKLELDQLAEFTKFYTRFSFRWTYENLVNYLNPVRLLSASEHDRDYESFELNLMALAFRLNDQQINTIFDHLLARIQHFEKARATMLKLVPYFTERQLVQYFDQLLIILQHRGPKQCLGALSIFCQISPYLTESQIALVDACLKDGPYKVYDFFKLATQRIPKENLIDFVLKQLSHENASNATVMTFLERYGYRRLLILLINNSNGVIDRAVIEKICSKCYDFINFAGESFKLFIEFWAPSLNETDIKRFFDQCVLVFCQLEWDTCEWSKMQIALDIICLLAEQFPNEVKKSYFGVNMEENSFLISGFLVLKYNAEKRQEFISYLETILLKETEAFSENAEAYTNVL